MAQPGLQRLEIRELRRRAVEERERARRELHAHWPWYGPAAIRLGIHSVTAVPLQLPTIRLGALCCYDIGPKSKADIAVVRVVVGALAPILLRTASSQSLRDLPESPRSVRDD